MSIQSIIEFLGNNQIAVLIYFACITLTSITSVKIVNKDNFGTLKYLFCVLVYAVTIPGVLAVFLTLYALLFLKSNLLNLDLLVFILPIFVMGISLFFLNKKIHMTQVPGFDKLSSLIIIVAITFGLIFLIQKMFIGIIFFSGFMPLAVIFVIVFIVLKVAWSRLTK